MAWLEESKQYKERLYERYGFNSLKENDTNTDSLTIKPINIQDYKSLYTKVIPMALEKDPKLYSGRYDNRWYGAFIGEENVAAFCIKLPETYQLTEPLEDNSINLSEIETRQEYQGRGIAGQIIEYVKKLAQQKGCDSVTLQAWEPSLEKFYSKHGFVNKTTEDNTKYMKYSL